MSLYRNIAKRRASGKPMRKAGQKGAPSAADFKNSAKTAKKRKKVRKTQMSTLYIHEKLRNIIVERENMITEQLIHGSVDDITAFKELRARLVELATIKQELDLLLKRIEHE